MLLKYIAGLLIGAGLVLLGYAVFEARQLRVVRYAVSVQGLPAGLEGLTILHLSDLHDKEFGAGQAQLLDRVDRLDFDLVAITGDLVNRKKPRAGPGLELVRQLQRREKPVYFVPGNHDRLTGFRFRDGLAAAGARILVNEAERFDYNGQHLWVVGVDDPYLGREDLRGALSEATDAAPKILLAHAPCIFEQAAALGVDLMLSGHTHGGQVRFPWLGALFTPGEGLFPRYDYGVYVSGSSTMIITGGLGESHLPIRFNMPPEIVLITLKQA